MNYETMTNDTLIATYKVARLTANQTAQKFTSRSIQFYNSMTFVLEANAEIERRGIERLAGIQYANSWD